MLNSVAGEEWQGPRSGKWVMNRLRSGDQEWQATVFNNSTIRKVKLGRLHVNYQPKSRCYSSVRRRRDRFIHPNTLLSSQERDLEGDTMAEELQCAKVASRWRDNPAEGYGTMNSRPLCRCEIRLALSNWPQDRLLCCDVVASLKTSSGFQEETQDGQYCNY